MKQPRARLPPRGTSTGPQKLVRAIPPAAPAPKVIVHDYAGHPFQVELSRELARRGYDVVHAYFADDCGPKGDMQRHADDPPGLAFHGLHVGGYSKDNFVRRRFGDIAYGRKLAELVRSEGADLVLSGNTPTEAQERLLAACRAAGTVFIPWIQDFYSMAATRLLSSRVGWPGELIGAFYRRLERRQLARADAVVIITEQFRERAERWCGMPEKVFTIENWGHIGISPLPKATAWSLRHGLADGFNFLYSGTLGMKHDPALLVQLARAMAGRARVVVAAQGSGVARLAQMTQTARLDNVVLLPLQSFADLPSTLACADVALALIEPDAGEFSVPSKVQSYLCAGRAVLMSSPAGNLAAEVLRRERAGLVTSPGHAGDFIAAAERLLQDGGLRAELAARGRAYAERAYDIGRVADRFERVFRRARDIQPVRAASRLQLTPTKESPP